MHIILIGNLTVGFHVLGPFDSYDDALSYAERNVAHGYYYIMRVHSTEERDAP